MITKLSIKGFKTLKDFSVPLTPVSVLVGPNNCGKSNVLRALGLLRSAVRVGLTEAIRQAGGSSDVLSRSGDGRLEISLEAQFAKTTVSYQVANPRSLFPRGLEQVSAAGEFELKATTLVPSGPQRASGSPPYSPGLGLRNLLGKHDCPQAIRQLGDFLEGLVVADLSMDRLRAKSLPIPGIELQPSGENLAAVLDRLHGERPSVRKNIEKEVSSVVPAITGIVTPTVDAEGNKVVGIAEGDQVFRADAVSDGILLFLALSTVTQMSGGRTLICLEEPDKGIHPRRIKDIVEQVNRVAATGSQFLMTTHSPVLLDEFRDFPESVLILDRPDGGTRATRLSELPDVQAQLREVSLGDLWYSGVLGGVPPK